MEACLKEPLPPPTELEESLRNGVTLAKLGHFFAPDICPLGKIYDLDQARFQVRGPGALLVCRSGRGSPLVWLTSATPHPLWGPRAGPGPLEARSGVKKLGKAPSQPRDWRSCSGVLSWGSCRPPQLGFCS